MTDAQSKQRLETAKEILQPWFPHLLPYTKDEVAHQNHIYKQAIAILGSHSAKERLDEVRMMDTAVRKWVRPSAQQIGMLLYIKERIKELETNNKE